MRHHLIAILARFSSSQLRFEPQALGRVLAQMKPNHFPVACTSVFLLMRAKIDAPGGFPSHTTRAF